jgi:hypothetical protein
MENIQRSVAIGQVNILFNAMTRKPVCENYCFGQNVQQRQGGEYIAQFSEGMFL